jgi:hypothetical protein
MQRKILRSTMKIGNEIHNKNLDLLFPRILKENGKEIQSNREVLYILGRKEDARFAALLMQQQSAGRGEKAKICRIHLQEINYDHIQYCKHICSKSTYAIQIFRQRLLQQSGQERFLSIVRLLDEAKKVRSDIQKMKL